jgi:hypothetical protein
VLRKREDAVRYLPFFFLLPDIKSALKFIFLCRGVEFVVFVNPLSAVDTLYAVVGEFKGFVLRY